jgi:hypothetical protein
MISIREKSHPIVLLMLSLISLLLLTACVTTSSETGTLEGHVTVGPLAPVVAPAPEIYSGREIVIFAEDGQTEVTRAKIDGSGNYRVTLPVGTYGVDINHLGIDIAKGLPQDIQIKAGQTTRLDVEIDTGIR